MNYQYNYVHKPLEDIDDSLNNPQDRDTDNNSVLLDQLKCIKQRYETLQANNKDLTTRNICLDTDLEDANIQIAYLRMGLENANFCIRNLRTELVNAKDVTIDMSNNIIDLKAKLEKSNNDLQNAIDVANKRQDDDKAKAEMNKKTYAITIIITLVLGGLIYLGLQKVLKSCSENDFEFKFDNILTQAKLFMIWKEANSMIQSHRQ